MGIENRVGAIGNNSLENCCIWAGSYFGRIINFRIHHAIGHFNIRVGGCSGCPGNDQMTRMSSCVVLVILVFCARFGWQSGLFPKVKETFLKHKSVDAYYDFYGNRLMPDFSLAEGNDYGNDDQEFRQLAGLVVAEDAIKPGMYVFDSFKFEDEAADSLVAITPPRQVNFSLILTRKMVYLKGMLLFDLMTVIHPSLKDFYIPIEDVMVLVCAHFLTVFDAHAYSDEFEVLASVLAREKANEVAQLCRDWLIEAQWDQLSALTGLVHYVLNSQHFISVWWLLESELISFSHLPNLPDFLDLLFAVEIKRAGVVAKLLDHFSEYYLLEGIPLLWTVAIKAEFEDDYEVIELLLDDNYDWNCADKEGLTLLGRWLRQVVSEEIPKLVSDRFIQSLLRENSLANQLTRRLPNAKSYIYEIGLILQENPLTDSLLMAMIKKMATISVSLPYNEVQWEVMFLEALESGQIWLLLRVLDDGVSSNAFTSEFLEQHLIEPLLMESIAPGELSSLFEASHAALITLLKWPKNIPRYDQTWTPISRSDSSNSLNSPRSATFLINLSRSRSLSRCSSPAAPPSISQNVLKSVYEIFTTRSKHARLIPKANQ